MADESKNKPAKVFSCGPVKAAIWIDHRVVDNAVVRIHLIRIEKSYKSGDQWQNTTTFTAEDLPKVAIVSDEVYRFLRVKSSAQPDCFQEDSHVSG